MKFEPIDAHIYNLAIRAGDEAEAIAEMLSGSNVRDDAEPMSVAGIAISTERERHLVLVPANEPYEGEQRLQISAILELSRLLRALPSKVSDEDAA